MLLPDKSRDEIISFRVENTQTAIRKMMHIPTNVDTVTNERGHRYEQLLVLSAFARNTVRLPSV